VTTLNRLVRDAGIAAQAGPNLQYKKRLQHQHAQPFFYACRFDYLTWGMQ